MCYNPWDPTNGSSGPVAGIHEPLKILCYNSQGSRRWSNFYSPFIKNLIIGILTIYIFRRGILMKIEKLTVWWMKLLPPESCLSLGFWLKSVSLCRPSEPPNPKLVLNHQLLSKIKKKRFFKLNSKFYNCTEKLAPQNLFSVLAQCAEIERE